MTRLRFGIFMAPFHVPTGQNPTVAYGRDLFEKTFRAEQLRTRLASLPANERLLLVADDPLVASIPWEYLRDVLSRIPAMQQSEISSLLPANWKPSA